MVLLISLADVPEVMHNQLGLNLPSSCTAFPQAFTVSYDVTTRFGDVYGANAFSLVPRDLTQIDRDENRRPRN